MDYPLLLVVAAACAIAAGVWARSARRLQKVAGRAENEFGRGSDAGTVARSSFRKDVHSTVLYAVLALATGAGAFMRQDSSWLFAVVLIPVAIVAALIAWLAFRYQLWRTGRSANRNVWRP